jgi:UPF0755 protein
MKKKIAIIVVAIFSFFVIACGCLFGYYKSSLEAVVTDKDDVKVIDFVVESGSTTTQIIDSLYNEKLIKNKYAAYVFVRLNDEYMMQAGVYELNNGMSLEEILTKITKGEVIDNSISVTFVEGKRITNYVKVINKNFGYSEDEILNVLSDKKYLQELIDKYWFLTEDILNDKLYYALEGYLAPNTYFFNKDASIKEIIEKLLNTTGKELEKVKDKIQASEYSIHEMLTMASIVELEGANSDDRKGVAGVFYNRLQNGWSLGSDVTTYYAEQIEMSDRDLYQKELDEVNDYNTRPAAMAGKLPVGPICNPGVESLKAAIEPEEHNYFFFVADKYKKTYFTKTNSEHIAIINKLKKDGLWYTYE